jgi:hypothetical protein
MIAVKEAGIPLADDFVQGVINSTLLNDDGVGIAYKREGSADIKILKGLVHPRAIEAVFENLNFQPGDEIIAHSRMGTSGLRASENCHPFILNPSGQLEDIACTQAITNYPVFVHNGVLSKYAQSKSAYPDTAHFAKEFLLKNMSDITVEGTRDFINASDIAGKYAFLFPVEGPGLVMAGEDFQEEEYGKFSTYAYNHTYNKEYATLKSLQNLKDTIKSINRLGETVTIFKHELDVIMSLKDVHYTTPPIKLPMVQQQQPVKPKFSYPDQPFSMQIPQDYLLDKRSSKPEVPKTPTTEPATPPVRAKDKPLVDKEKRNLNNIINMPLTVAKMIQSYVKTLGLDEKPSQEEFEDVSHNLGYIVEKSFGNYFSAFDPSKFNCAEYFIHCEIDPHNTHLEKGRVYYLSFNGTKTTKRRDGKIYFTASYFEGDKVKVSVPTDSDEIVKYCTCIPREPFQEKYEDLMEIHERLKEPTKSSMKMLYKRLLIANRIGKETIVIKRFNSLRFNRYAIAEFLYEHRELYNVDNMNADLVPRPFQIGMVI